MMRRRASQPIWGDSVTREYDRCDVEGSPRCMRFTTAMLPQANYTLKPRWREAGSVLNARAGVQQKNPIHAMGWLADPPRRPGKVVLVFDAGYR
jgi:hypothetical protein